VSIAPSTPEPLSVLVIDDDEVIQKLVAGILKPSGLTVLFANSGEEGMSIALARPIELILLDNEMPGASGIDVLRELKAHPCLASVPVIMVTASEGSRVLSECFAAGAVDYLRKPFSSAELRARVNSVLERHRLMSALTKAARTDRLTGLANRSQLTDHLSAALQRLEANEGLPFTVLFLDFDRFKLVNDTLGHDVGDLLLQAIAGRLLHNLRSSESASRGTSGTLVARLGGDEFVVVLDGTNSPEDTHVVAARLLAALDRPYQLGPHVVRSTASIGSVQSAAHYQSSDEMLRDADIAMYEAKARGKACHVVFNPEMREDVATRVALENALHSALGTPQLHIALQPIYSLDNHSVNGVEALARWTHPTLGEIEPDVFIPVAEESGVMLQLSDFILREACKQFSQLQALLPVGTASQLEYVSVNLSRIQLADPGLVARTLEIVREANMQPDQLQIEVTESQVMQYRPMAQPLLAEFSRHGVRLALDNFGSGHSSLSCLQDFTVDTLKIDKALLANAARGRGFAALLHAILTLAENLDLKVIAEGVETHEQLVLLEALGCTSAQGFLLSRPLTLQECAELLTVGAGTVRNAHALES